MSGILDKLEARVTSKRTTIADARTVIASASSEIKLQAEKDYTLQITSESKARAEAQAVREKLHTDLQSVRKLVINAKQTVSNVIRVAKSDKNKEGAISGQQ